MPTIPVVDLRGSAIPGMRRGLAGLVTDALRRSSCTWIEGHGVPPASHDEEAAWAAYRDAVAGVAATVVELVVEHLHLPVGHHQPSSLARCAVLVARHEGADAPGDSLAGAAAWRSRRARGWITVRGFEGSVSGLEVRHAGRWVTVLPRPEALLVHTGELLERWTNGVLPTALLRAAERTASGAQCWTFAVHHQPPADTVVAPAPSCAGHSGLRYAPVRWEGLAVGAEWSRSWSPSPAATLDGTGRPSARTASMVSASAATCPGGIA